MTEKQINAKIAKYQATIAKRVQNKELDTLEILAEELATLEKQLKDLKKPKVKAKPKTTPKAKKITTTKKSPKSEREKVYDVAANVDEFAMPKKDGVDPKKKPCKLIPFSKKRTPDFTDLPDVQATVKVRQGKKIVEVKEDTLLWSGRRPTRRRPPAQKISIECTKCNRTVQVYPSQIPENIGDTPEDRPSYVCNRCSS